MKTRNIFYSAALAVVGLAMTSCDHFLDTMPDNRTTIDNEEKVKGILVGAYPTHEYASRSVEMCEVMIIEQFSFLEI